MNECVKNQSNRMENAMEDEGGKNAGEMD